MSKQLFNMSQSSIPIPPEKFFRGYRNGTLGWNGLNYEYIIWHPTSFSSGHKHSIWVELNSFRIHYWHQDEFMKKVIFSLEKNSSQRKTFNRENIKSFPWIKTYIGYSTNDFYFLTKTCFFLHILYIFNLSMDCSTSTII